MLVERQRIALNSEIGELARSERRSIVAVRGQLDGDRVPLFALDGVYPVSGSRTRQCAPQTEMDQADQGHSTQGQQQQCLRGLPEPAESILDEDRMQHCGDHGHQSETYMVARHRP